MTAAQDVLLGKCGDSVEKKMGREYRAIQMLIRSGYYIAVGLTKRKIKRTTATQGKFWFGSSTTVFNNRGQMFARNRRDG